MTKIKRITACLILAALTIITFPKKAQAILADVTSMSGSTVSGAMDTAFSKLGLDQDELKYFTTSFNYSRQKKQQPQMTLNFSPANPVPGQKVTVVATPKYFLNDPKDLYFTWYLKPAGCPSSSETSPSDDIKDKCDFNNNGTVDIEDYKVRAMRIIASGGFEWNKEDENGETTYESTGNNGGASYEASWGGEDQKYKTEHCYIHSTETGDEYEIDCDKHLFPNAKGDTTGDGDYKIDEEKFWHTDPDADDTAGTGNGDEANVAGLGVTSFTWTYDEGDKVGVAIEGISTEPAQSDDSSYRTMWALVNNKCNLGDKSFDSKYSGTTTSVSHDSSGACGEDVDDEEITYTITKTIINRAANVVTVRQTTYKTKITDANCDGVYDEDPGAAYNQTTTCPGADYLGKFDNITCSGYDSVIALNSDELTLENIKEASDLNDCLYSNMVNPKEGGGQASKIDISLDYSPDSPINNSQEDSTEGDLVTISSSVLNGESDEYLKYKWEVFASDTPNPEDWGDPISKSYLKEASQTLGVGLETFKFRLNLTSTALGSRVSKKNKFYLKVKLTVSENVSESIDDEAGDSSNVATREGYADVVIPISSTTAKIKIYDAIALQGDGDDVRLSPGSDEKCTSDLSAAICPVTKNEIIALTVDSSLTDYSWTLDGKKIQPVSSDCLSGDCKASSMESTNTAYFPILDDVGTKYTASLQAINSKTGEKIELSRNFIVVDPAISISSPTSSDEFSPVLLGHYIDLDGNLWPDYSKTNFEALADTTFSLQGDFTGFSNDGTNYAWFVDGEAVTSSNADELGYGLDSSGTLSLPAKDTGESYDVKLVALYAQSTSTKKALNAFWNATYTDFYEKKLENSIAVKTVDSLSGSQTSQSKTTPKKILASLYSATPEYLAFLLRIILTAFVMLVSARVIFSYLPNTDIKTDGI